jgi:hypothetical protein
LMRIDDGLPQNGDRRAQTTTTAWEAFQQATATSSATLCHRPRTASTNKSAMSVSRINDLRQRCCIRFARHTLSEPCDGSAFVENCFPALRTESGEEQHYVWTSRERRRPLALIPVEHGNALPCRCHDDAKQYE